MELRHSKKRVRFNLIEFSEEDSMHRHERVH